MTPRATFLKLLAASVVVAAAAVVALALRAQPGTAGAGAEAVTAAPPKIVFSRGTNSRAELYVRRGDGTLVRLTRNRSFDGFPVWSPSGKRIAFVSGRGGDADIYVMRADGTNVRRLTGGTRPGGGAHDLYPTWSPDGRLIAFSSNRGGVENEIYVMRADGTKVRRLTRTPGYVDDVQPSFSPDGRFLVFASNRLAYSNYEVYRVRVSDGRGLRRLTFWGSGGDLTPGDDLMPSYSPDGSRIAFVSDRGGGYAIWTMNATGGALREVVRHPGRNHALPRFSPDGTALVYTTFSPEASPPDVRVSTVAAAGGTPTDLGVGAEADW